MQHDVTWGLTCCCCLLLLCTCRALVFVAKFFGGVVPTPCNKGADKVAELGAAVSEKLQEYLAAMEKVRRGTMPVAARSAFLSACMHCVDCC
jgi:hypothetical protein